MTEAFAARRRSLTLRRAFAAAVAMTFATPLGSPKDAHAEEARYPHVHEKLLELVEQLEKQRPKDKVVMLGSIRGANVDLLRRALEQALLDRKIERANTEAEMRALRARYRKQGVDIYENPEMQRLLRAQSKAKLTLELESQCSEDEALERCDIWLRGFLPSTMAFSEHATYEIAKPKPETPPNPYDHFRRFLLLLVAYAFGPVLLHRLDLMGRNIDGSWRSWLLTPLYLLGNRIVTFVLVLSFVLVGPWAFERWVSPLPSDLESVLTNMGIAAGSTLALHLIGALFVSLWRDSRRSGGYRSSFRELFVLHPNFWTRMIEGDSKRRF